MKFYRSIRWRLQLWYGLLLLLVLAGFGFTAMRLERDREFQRLDERLQSRLRILEDATRPSVGRRPQNRGENNSPPPGRNENDPPPSRESRSTPPQATENNSQVARELNFRRGERGLFDNQDGY